MIKLLIIIGKFFIEGIAFIVTVLGALVIHMAQANGMINNGVYGAVFGVILFTYLASFLGAILVGIYDNGVKQNKLLEQLVRKDERE